MVADGPDGDQVYVCDFGLARHVSSVGSLTGDRGFVGTIDYVAPEQIRGGQVDGRVDVYALGCILFECLTGERPFERESELATVFAHLNEAPPRPSEVRPELPRAFDGVVARALAKEPADRFGSCGELVAAAHDALEGRATKRSRRLPLLAAGAAVLAVAVAAVGLWLAERGGSPPPAAAPAHLLAALDAGSGAVLATDVSARGGGFGAAPSDVVLARGSAWELVPSEQRVFRIGLRSRRELGSVALPWTPLDRLAVAGGFVWAAQSGGPQLARISEATGRLVDKVTPRSAPLTGLTAGGGYLWIADGQGAAAIVPANGAVGHSIPYSGSGRIVYGDGALWSIEDGGVVEKLDPLTGRVLGHMRVPGGGDVTDLVFGAGLVWAGVVPDNVVDGFDPRDLRLRRRIQVDADPERVVFAGGRLWVAGTAANKLSVLGPNGGTHRTFALAAAPAAVAELGGVVWTALVPARLSLPPVDGPELRIAMPEELLTLDPAELHSSPDEQLQGATCAGLVGYPDLVGAAGQRLEPVVATAMPHVSADGRVYTFRLRSGFRFSPPSNELLTAAVYKRSLERAFSSKLGPGTRGHSDQPDLVGLPAFQAGKAAHIAGITAKGDTLVFRLVRPAGDFLTKLALPNLCPVPSTTPIAQQPPSQPVASAGPYYVASSANGRVVLLRNPGYRGERRRPWARIVYTEDVPTPVAVGLADRRAVDVVLDLDPTSLTGPNRVLDRRFGPGRGTRQRWFPAAGSFLDTIVLNAGRPLFHSVEMRHAVNDALDRAQLAAAFNDTPTDEIVPASVPGFHAGTVFPLTPRLAAARRLAGATPHRAVLSYCTHFPSGDPGLTAIAHIVRANLARIGIAVSIVRTAECPRMYDASSKRADLLLVTNWGDTLRDPQAFLDNALADGTYGSALGPGPWTVAGFRRRLAAAAALRGAARTTAYVRLTRELTRAAPFAVYGMFLSGQYVSPTLGCEQTNGASSYLDLVALCRRA